MLSSKGILTGPSSRVETLQFEDTITELASAFSEEVMQRFFALRLRLGYRNRFLRVLRWYLFVGGGSRSKERRDCPQSFVRLRCSRFLVAFLQAQIM